MAFDEDKIRIEVEGAQAAAQLEALAEDVRLLEEHLASLDAAGSKSGVEFENVSAKLGEAKAKFFEASEATKTFEQSATGADLSLKGMTKSIGAGLSILSILRDNLQALEPVQKALAENFRAGAIEAGVNSETLDNVTRSLDSLIHPSHIAKNAVEALSIAFEKGAKLAHEWGLGNKEAAETAAQAWANAVGPVYAAIQAQEKLNAAVFGSKKEIASFSDAVIQSVGALLRHGDATEEQMARARESIQKAIDDELTAFGRVPPALQALADQLGVVRSLQEDAAKSLAKEEEALEKAAVKSAQERAKAEQKAADEIAKAMAAEMKALDDNIKKTEEAWQAHLKRQEEKQKQKIEESAKPVVDENTKAVEELDKAKKEFNASPIVDQNQIDNLDRLKDATRGAGFEFGKINDQVFFGNGLWSDAADAAEGANLAFDRYIALAKKNYEVTDRANAAILDGTDGLDDFGAAAEDAAGALGDASDSLGALGDKAKKGTDKASEGLDKMKGGLEEAIPLAETLRDILQEIVALGAQADI